MVLYYGAGVLPFARHPSGKICVLLGKDVRTENGWSDYGGKAERSDRPLASQSGGIAMGANVIATAARELVEETLGVLGDPASLRRYISPDTTVLLHGRTQNKFPYYCFLLEIPYDPTLRAEFRRIVSFLTWRNLHRQLVEKTDIQFVCASKLFDDRFPKRSVFAATINSNRALLADVIEQLERGETWMDVCRSHRWTADELV